MNCETCKEKRADPVPYIVHEGDMARQERTISRLSVIIILLIALLVGSNAAWLYYESQYETVSVVQEVEQEADDNGVNRFVGGDYYGSTESENNSDSAG